MNIFFVQLCAAAAARDLCDKHIVKMILETAQLLSCAFWCLAPQTTLQLYRKTHVNHPSAVWTRTVRHAAAPPPARARTTTAAAAVALRVCFAHVWRCDRCVVWGQTCGMGTRERHCVCISGFACIFFAHAANVSPLLPPHARAKHRADSAMRVAASCDDTVPILPPSPHVSLV